MILDMENPRRQVVSALQSCCNYYWGPSSDQVTKKTFESGGVGSSDHGSWLPVACACSCWCMGKLFGSVHQFDLGLKF